MSSLSNEAPIYDRPWVKSKPKLKKSLSKKLEPMATRKSSELVLKTLQSHGFLWQQLIGGSADLSGSNIYKVKWYESATSPGSEFMDNTVNNIPIETDFLINSHTF